MLDQTFSKKSLEYSFIKSDFEFGKTTEESNIFKNDILERCEEIIINEEMPIYLKGFSNKRIVYKMEELSHQLIVRSVTAILKKVYRVKYTSRDTILRELIPLLSNPSSYQVLRLDIASFYDSIPLQEMMKLIDQNEKILNKTKKIIRMYLTSMRKEKKVDGLMQGHPLSAILSEVCMADFDIKIKGIGGVVLYHRFVDDIIIVTCKKDIIKKEMIAQIEKKLPFDTLRLNPKKQSFIEFNRFQQQGDFNFLGYNINIENRIVSLSIENKKIKKMKKKIYFSIKKFNNEKIVHKIIAEKELKFFLDSMKCLASASVMKKKKLSLPVGNRLNYKFLTCNGVSLMPVDDFLHSIPYAKSDKEIQKFNEVLKKFGIYQEMVKEIQKISFVGFYKNNIYIQFPRERAKDIWRVWKYA